MGDKPPGGHARLLRRSMRTQYDADTPQSKLVEAGNEQQKQKPQNRESRRKQQLRRQQQQQEGEEPRFAGPQEPFEYSVLFPRGRKLGLTLAPSTSDSTADDPGARVHRVAPRSPAALNGVEAGSLITKVDGQSIAWLSCTDIVGVCRALSRPSSGRGGADGL